MATENQNIQSTASGIDGGVTTDDSKDVSRRELGRLAVYTAPAMVALLTTAQAQTASTPQCVTTQLIKCTETAQ
jgi:hypothetical protein